MAGHVASGVKSREKLSGGMVGEVELVTFNDGSRAVHKVAHDVILSPKHQQDAEELGSKVAHALGVRAPEVYRAGEAEVFMDHMPGRPAITELGSGRGRDSRWATSPEGVRVGLLDMLIDNNDRNTGNWLIDGDHISAIDHGAAFRFNIGAKGEPRYSAVSAFETHFVRNARNGGGGEWVDNPLTQAEVADVRAKLEDLRPEFDRLDRGAWHDSMMARLDGIERHAKGDRSASVREGEAALGAAPTRLTGRRDVAGAQLVGKSSFTAGQVKALERYRDDSYDVNAALRAGKHNGDAREIDAVMAKSPLSAEVVAVRGIRNPARVFGDAWNGTDVTGLEWAEAAYVSTTVDPRVAARFGKPFERGEAPGAVMWISVPKGTGAIQLSDFGDGRRDEAELLLQRGLRLRVTRDRGTVDGLRMLDVEVVPNA
jgi:hypothetical protein